MIWGSHGPLHEKNATIDELKMPNFRPFFSLMYRIFGYYKGEAPLPFTKKILNLMFSKCLINSGTFSVSVYKYD